MHEPADINGELLRLGTGQKHAVIEGVQKPALPDPAFLVDDDPVHDCDLSRGAAEAQGRHA